MAYRSLTFDTEVVQPTNGNPPGVSYASGSQHYINKVWILKQNNSPLKLDMTLGSIKTDIFGDSLTFALLADKPMTFGSPSHGSSVQTWRSWYKPANSISQATASDRPTYFTTGGAETIFFNRDFMDLPSAFFNFTSTTEFTIFVSFDQVSQNSSDEAFLFGGTNSSRSDLLSVWGIENDQCAIYDNANNDSVWSGTNMAGGSIRMLSHHTDKTVWDYHDGIEELEEPSDFTSAFDFDFLNKAITSAGSQGIGTFKINELLVYDESISTMGATTRQKIEGYLAHKWGTNSALRNADGSTGHPYVTTDPRGTEDWEFSSPITTTKSGSITGTTPLLSTFADADYDIYTFGSGTSGNLVTANQLVKFAVVDMEKPGKVYIRVEYTGA